MKFGVQLQSQSWGLDNIMSFGLCESSSAPILRSQVTQICGDEYKRPAVSHMFIVDTMHCDPKNGAAGLCQPGFRNQHLTIPSIFISSLYDIRVLSNTIFFSLPSALTNSGASQRTSCRTTSASARALLT